MKLGSGVKKITDALGIPQCAECAARQQWLDALGSRISKALSYPKTEEANDDRTEVRNSDQL